MEDNGNRTRDEVFSISVRAGKRTYFFDVKSTKTEKLYLTITESKKRLGTEGKVFYEKHKIFLYKEDFEKFTEGLKDAVSYIDNGRDGMTVPILSLDEETRNEKSSITEEEFTNVEFEDLGKK